MGNTITKDNDTINWNNLKTDNFSDSLNNKYLSNDSKLLLSKLDINLSNIPNNETDSIDDIFSKYQSQSQSQLISNEFNTTTSLDNKNSVELSETSPFISSEMYNYLVKKNQLSDNNNQKGGALNDDILNDDSSTSETSESDSDSDYKSDKPKTKKDKSKKPESKKPESKKPESKKPESKKSKSKKPEPDSDYLSNSEEDEPKPKSDKHDSDEPDSNEPESDEREYNSKYNSKYNSNSSELSKDSVSNNDNLSYVSSPGNSLNSTDSNSEKLSGGSISNNNDYIPPSSINTSDINMISEAS
jgi:hypothetical protein